MIHWDDICPSMFCYSMSHKESEMVKVTLRLLGIQKKLLPDMLDLMKKRYEVLHFIRLMQPVGRRSLASTLDMTERILRSEIDFLKSQDLLHVAVTGMSLTTEGYQLLEDLEPFAKDLFGLTDIEAKLAKILDIRKVVIVSGDCDTSPLAKKALGQAGAKILRQYLDREQTVAITGGSTIAEVVHMLVPSTSMKGTLFVPARGGIGEDVEHQANTLASQLAKKTGGQYRLLHVPDQLSEEVYQSLMQEPHIQELLREIQSARIVIHGVGEAISMAERRKSDPALIEKLKHSEAVGEAFGYYFGKDQRIVHKMPSVGLRLEDIQHVQTVIAVAGGRSKADAIRAFVAQGYNDILVTDEGAARELMKVDSG
jgi:central glycolytic genes regulator